MTPAHALPLLLPNPFLTMDLDEPTRIQNNSCERTSGSLVSRSLVSTAISKPLFDAEWAESCRPRLLDVLSKGAGHAVI